MNRAERRTMLHALRADGCTCSPALEAMPLDTVPAPFVGGHIVEHGRGCPLGEWAKRLNGAGILPGLIARPSKRCAR